MLRSPIRLRYDDEDDDVSHYDVERMPCDVLTPDMQPQDTRSPFVAHSSNGRTKFKSGDKTRDGISPIAANETCIWSLAYSDGKRKKCCGTRIIRTTCDLDKKQPCRFRVTRKYDEIDVPDAAYYPTLKDNFQRQTCREIFPEERVHNRDKKSSFVESCVWMRFQTKLWSVRGEYIKSRKI